MISVAARLADLPVWVLRVLDQEGIVVPVRTESNRRLYSDNDIRLLMHVHHLMVERKVNINGIKVILEMERAAREGAPSPGPSTDGETPDSPDTPRSAARPALAEVTALVKTNGSHS
ncbi:MAG: MerR family transcriptional regulator [Capsulimonadales bacterium]|nr:MerR family transcriptional regulator [Capsulimonadales bacterium]